MKNWLCWAALAALLWGGTAGARQLKEEVVQVPVKVTNAFGKMIERPITVTVFQETDRARYPLLILNHGRAANAASRQQLGRARYSEQSRWFASQGWSVWVPTRIGYGVSGIDEDPEESGPCRNKRYEPAYAAAAAQVMQVMEFARARPEIDAKKTLVVGQSMGGATAVAVASLNPDGLVAAINFAGGGGGDPVGRPGEPCEPALLERMFGGYGRTARVPMLWVYTENDLYFKPEYTKSWFEAYRRAGGQGEYLLLPPYKEDGHGLFATGIGVWKPLVERFLESLR